MDEYDLTRLPVHGQPPSDATTDDEASCSPKIYVSNEEASLLAALRKLRERAVEVRRHLESADSSDRERLTSELEQMRRDRKELEKRRENAFTRKMVMLGHLPPSALDD